MTEYALMPLLDIAIPQPSFQNLLGTSEVQPQLHGNISGKFTFGKDKRLASTWKVSIQIPSKKNFKAGHLKMRSAVQIREFFTLESKCFVQREDGHKGDHNRQLGPDSNPQAFQSSTEDSVKMDESERLRRIRISKANKGTVPWNKGRKHSAETLRRIRERTKLAMQDPKVRMKLLNLGHPHSEETRIKIGVRVRLGWQRRREKLMVQKTCYLEWQNLIAEASRGGYDGEVELNWDSYKILDVQLQQEWLESIKQRKSAPRPKVCKRAPKSPEQRRKISEAISAKWADPGYRERVCSAMTKYHGLPIVAERKRMKRPSGTQSIRRSLAENNPSETSNFSGSETKSQGWSGLKRSSAPSYRDPLANSKLKMIKKIRMKRPTGETQYIKSRDEKKPSDAYNFAGNETKSQCWSGLKRSSALSYKDLANSKLKLIKIRAQRAAMETKKKEAIERAKLLIAEAEKATKALELVAMKSPIAGASLTESRKLVAEAIRLIEEIGQITPRQSKTGTNGLISHFKEETVTGKRDLKLAKKREVHGTHIFSSISSKNEIILDIGGKLALQEFNCGEEPPSKCCVSPPLEPNSLKQQSVSTDQQMVHLKPKGSTYYHSVPVPNGVARMQAGKANTSSSKTKKWLRGRLVEVAGD